MRTCEEATLEIFSVTSGTEHPLMMAGVALLRTCLETAGTRNPTITLTCVDAVRSDFLVPDAPRIPEELYHQGLVPRGASYPGKALLEQNRQVIVLSLLADVCQQALRHRRDGYLFLPLPAWQSQWTPAQRDQVQADFVAEPEIDLAVAAHCWRRILSAVQQANRANVFLCNVFRHVPGRLPYRYHGQAPSLGERIRRFNLLATELSQETGICIVEVDRAFADAGAGPLQTDYRLTGEAAAAAGADILVSTLLRAGLDDYFSVEIQEKALAALDARRAAVDWLASQAYQGLLGGFLAGMQALETGIQRDAGGAIEFGKTLLNWAERVKAVGVGGPLSSHRQLSTAIRELGTAYVDAGRALAAGDNATYQQAATRVHQRKQQLGSFWKVIHDMVQRNATSPE